MELDPDIALHYSQGVERDRLTTWGRLEAERTRDLLSRFLPRPPAVILDVGGAKGAYALPLARSGYVVHLLDPVPSHVEAARAASAAQPLQPLAEVEIGDAQYLRARQRCRCRAPTRPPSTTWSTPLIGQRHSPKRTACFGQAGPFSS